MKCIFNLTKSISVLTAVSFYDQNGNVIASGVLSHNEDRYTFIQNTGSDWVPKEALMDRY